MRVYFCYLKIHLILPADNIHILMVLEGLGLVAGIRCSASAIGICGQTLDAPPLLSITLSSMFAFLLLWVLLFGGLDKLHFNFGGEGLKIGI